MSKNFQMKILELILTVNLYSNPKTGKTITMVYLFI